MQLYQLSFPNGKKYIGITSKTAQERFKEHCKSNSGCKSLSRAIKKYGKESVVLKVLSECDNWELLQLAEIEAIEKFNTFGKNGYNLTLGGDGNNGIVFSNGTKAKIAENTRVMMSCPIMKARIAKSSKEYWNSQAGKAIASTRNIGRVCSQKTKIKISNSHIGITHTEETRAKISENSKKQFSTQKARLAASERTKKHFENPEVRKASSDRAKAQMTPEMKQRLSEANKGKIQSEETINKRKESFNAAIAKRKESGIVIKRVISEESKQKQIASLKATLAAKKAKMTMSS